MPTESELPLKLRPLAWRQAVELTHARFIADSKVLVESVARDSLSETSAAGTVAMTRVTAASASPQPSNKRSALFALGFALLGSLVAAAGVLLEFLPNDMRGFDGRVRYSTIHTDEVYRQASLLTPFFNARWFIFFGLALMIGGIVAGGADWRRSPTGARWVIAISGFAALTSGLFALAAQAFDRIDSSMYVREATYFVYTPEFTVMLAYALAIVSIVVVVAHLRHATAYASAK